MTKTLVSALSSPPLLSTPTRFVVVVHSSSSTPAPVSVSAITNEMQALLVVDEIPDELSADEVAIVFSFLRHVDIMRRNSYSLSRSEDFYVLTCTYPQSY